MRGTSVPGQAVETRACVTEESSRSRAGSGLDGSPGMGDANGFPRAVPHTSEVGTAGSGLGLVEVVFPSAEQWRAGGSRLPFVLVFWSPFLLCLTKSKGGFLSFSPCVISLQIGIGRFYYILEGSFFLNSSVLQVRAVLSFQP